MNLDCIDKETRIRHMTLFKSCNTVKEFLILWASFYENQICLPTYFDTFYGNPSGDNPQASHHLGQKFKAITLHGVIPIDSQVTIPYEQKGYIDVYVHNDDIRRLAAQLNRYNNIVAFHYPLNTKERGARDLWVTYDSYNADKRLNQELGFPTGSPYTQAGIVNNYMPHISEWLNTQLRKLININTFSQLTIINPSYDSDPEYAVDVLLEVLTLL